MSGKYTRFYRQYIIDKVAQMQAESDDALGMTTAHVRVRTPSAELYGREFEVGICFRNTLINGKFDFMLQTPAQEKDFVSILDKALKNEFLAFAEIPSVNEIFETDAFADRWIVAIKGGLVKGGYQTTNMVMVSVDMEDKNDAVLLATLSEYPIVKVHERPFSRGNLQE